MNQRLACWTAAAGVLVAALVLRGEFRTGVHGVAGTSSGEGRRAEIEAGARAAALSGVALTSVQGRLVDADGRERSLAELAGQPFIAAVIYTRCPTVCPMLVEGLRRMERASAPADSLRFVLFSLDP